MGLGALIQAIALIQPQYGGALISSVQDGTPTLSIIGVLCILLLLNAILSMLQQALIGKASESTVKNTRLRLSKVFFLLPVLCQESKAPGWYSQRISNDTEYINRIPAKLN
jgi:ABC-type bacteriocin/lantibiotic exporter with double-glycine peptidase domain